jgi:hypothetical protein
MIQTVRTIHRNVKRCHRYGDMRKPLTAAGMLQAGNLSSTDPSAIPISRTP